MSFLFIRILTVLFALAGIFSSVPGQAATLSEWKMYAGHQVRSTCARLFGSNPRNKVHGYRSTDFQKRLDGATHRFEELRLYDQLILVLPSDPEKASSLVREIVTVIRRIEPTAGQTQADANIKAPLHEVEKGQSAAASELSGPSLTNADHSTDTAGTQPIKALPHSPNEVQALTSRLLERQEMFDPVRVFSAADSNFDVQVTRLKDSSFIAVVSYVGKDAGTVVNALRDGLPGTEVLPNVLNQSTPIEHFLDEKESLAPLFRVFNEFATQLGSVNGKAPASDQWQRVVEDDLRRGSWSNLLHFELQRLDEKQRSFSARANQALLSSLPVPRSVSEIKSTLPFDSQFWGSHSVAETVSLVDQALNQNTSAVSDKLITLSFHDEQGRQLHLTAAVPLLFTVDEAGQINARPTQLRSDLMKELMPGQTTVLFSIYPEHQARPFIGADQVNQIKELLERALNQSSSSDQVTSSSSMNRTTFAIPKMDCASEEQMVRMALRGQEDVHELAFDLPGRRLVVTHDGSPEAVHALIQPLGFGAQVIVTEVVQLKDRENVPRADEAQESRVLKQLLAINGSMFVAELGVGLLAGSTALITDSLDMLADAAVYTVSLYAVGRSVGLQKRAARISGYLQIGLAGAALAEVARRTVFGSAPEPSYMMAMSATALVANTACLYLIHKHRGGGVHMRASWIFSANDVIANLGVLAAGALVAVSGSPAPDLVVGAIIGGIVLRGGWSILKLSR